VASAEGRFLSPAETGLEGVHLGLYQLIFMRTTASVMADAVLDYTTALLDAVPQVSPTMTECKCNSSSISFVSLCNSSSCTICVLVLSQFYSAWTCMVQCQASRASRYNNIAVSGRSDAVLDHTTAPLDAVPQVSTDIRVGRAAQWHPLADLGFLSEY
jgi:hypothetical protein